MKSRVCVIGAGHQGLTMAAHLSLSGCEVGLWNRTSSHIAEILNSGEIKCSGLYEKNARIAKVSTDIQDVIAEQIMVTVPSSAHRDVAKLLAPYMSSRYLVVLNPGRTFGAWEFALELQRNGCKELPLIVETQTIVYTCRRDSSNQVVLYALKKDVQMTTFQKNKAVEAWQRMPEVLRSHFHPVDDYLAVTLNNVGMVLHCAPLLFNIGWVENEKVDFKYYYEGITPTIASFIEKIDVERLAVAKALGHPIESVSDWLRRTYGAKGANLYQCLRDNEAYRKIDAPRSMHHRYIEEDVPTGLVAFESAGKTIGVETPCISLIIDLAEQIMNMDYRANGRDYAILHRVCAGDSQLC
ncbi:NAD/NADP-dependent octopine/nopaline dehydrogenase family protein [Selenomonas ruminantium]|uniref:NAD/NADP-dependent octopine/nopaline dehydrogenase family protein n=1 Tax=Selenomonas ruminantium TaxID=971 RepID=UPI000427EC97|nr:NAD/NADP-dependent octopine/nopaline dehydrogenase family protein [Selenomonas ruminantium]